MKILFLDDNEARHKRFLREHIGCDVHQVWTADQAIGLLEEDPDGWDLISLDHDLNDAQQLACIMDEPLPAFGEKTGYDVACWMEECFVDVKDIVIHSFNNQGAARMYQALEKTYPSVRRIPFGMRG